jgi:stage V sporulation protein AC
MEKIETQQQYNEFVKQKSPNSPIWKDCFNAFWVGGLICTIGQFIMDYCMYRGMDNTSASTVTSIVLILIAVILSGLNWFNRIGKFAGAGSLVPITGFANSIVSPAIEYKSEGYVMGVGGKMFTVAGPVLVYGISTSVIIGIIAVLLK